MIYKMKKKSEINISIVILNFNSHEFTINCLKSIELSIDKYLEYEIIIVDNGSNISDFKLLNQKIEKPNLHTVIYQSLYENFCTTCSK